MATKTTKKAKKAKGKAAKERLPTPTPLQSLARRVEVLEAGEGATLGLLRHISHLLCAQNARIMELQRLTHEPSAEELADASIAMYASEQYLFRDEMSR